MKQTLLVTLAPTPEQHAALVRTLEAFNAAGNAIAAVAFQARMASTIDRQKLVYYAIRHACGLAAQLAIRASPRSAKPTNVTRRNSRVFARMARWSMTSACSRSPAWIARRC